MTFAKVTRFRSEEHEPASIHRLPGNADCIGEQADPVTTRFG
jgi:hypothetical protein